MDTIYHTVYYEYTNKKDMKVVLCNYGAQLYSVTLGEQVVTFTLWNRSIQMSSMKMYGKVVGPLANRIFKGFINPKSHPKIQLKNKLNENDVTLTNFGEDSLAFLEFFVTENDTFSYHEFIFNRDVVDEVNNHLFDAHVEIIYQIYKRENKINVIHKVTPVKSTYYSLANNLYFCLSRKQRVTANKLFIDAKQFGLLNNDKITTGFAPVDEVFDFSRAKLIGDFIYKTYPKIALGYDHDYLFQDNYNEKNPRIVLTGDKYELSIFTDYDACHIYTNNYSDIKERMLQRDYNKRYDGIAIVPQIEPGNYDKMFIKAGETRENYVTYSFKEVKK